MLRERERNCAERYTLPSEPADFTRDKIAGRDPTKYRGLASTSVITPEVMVSPDPSHQVRESGPSSGKLGGGGARESFRLSIGDRTFAIN